MFIPSSYSFAVVLCIITMFCWGSWANTQKLASKSWPFPLFYWDYSLGIILCTLIFGLTLGSGGLEGRSFVTDLMQADAGTYVSALLGGIIFNLANLLVVAAIDIAGMAVAFPIGIGIALVLGVIVNYLANPVGDPVLLFIGVGLVTIAIVIDAIAYKHHSSGDTKSSTRGMVYATFGGILMAFFFRLVASSMSTNFVAPETGLFTPYSAVFVFALGIFLSNFVWNSYFMFKPISGSPMTYKDYFKLGSMKTHGVGLLGGIIWCIGMSFSLIAAEKAGFAISYGLGQGATMVAAAWGVFIWKEFAGASRKTNQLIGLMFICFIAGLVTIVLARG